MLKKKRGRVWRLSLLVLLGILLQSLFLFALENPYPNPTDNEDICHIVATVLNGEGHRIELNDLGGAVIGEGCTIGVEDNCYIPVAGLAFEKYFLTDKDCSGDCSKSFLVSPSGGCIRKPEGPIGCQNDLSTEECQNECPSGWPPPFEVTNYIANDGSDGCCGDDEKEYGKTIIDPASPLGSTQYICVRSSDGWSWEAITGAKSIEENPNIHKIKSIYPDSNDNTGVLFYDVIGEFDDEKGRWYACDANGVPYFDGGDKFRIEKYGFLPKEAFQGIGTVVLPSGNDLKGTPGTDIIDINLIKKDNFIIGGTSQQPESISSTGWLGEPPDDPNRKSFICYKKGKAGLFEECCGTYGKCNSDSMMAHITGQPLDTVEEFLPLKEAGLKDNNYVLVLPIDSSNSEWYYQIMYRADKKDLWINDWSDYESIDFYLYYTKSLNGLTFIVSDENDKSNYILRVVSRYTDKEPFRWHHVSIPIGALFNVDLEQIKKIRFEFDPKFIETEKDDLTTNIPGFQGNYYDIFVIDRIYLVPKAGTGKPYFCNDGREWVDATQYDMDDVIMRSVCQAQPGYIWTENNCCGDDGNEYYDGDSIGCWDGLGIPDDKRVGDIINYEYRNDVLFHGGNFHGCNLDSAQYKGQWIGSGKDIDMEIKNEALCTHLESSNYYCDSIIHDWEPISTIKSDPKPDSNTNIGLRKAPYTNLLDYANFEDAAWALENAAIDSSDVKQGEKSLHLKGGSGQRSTSNVAGKYTLSGWVKVKEKSMPAEIQIFEGMTAEGEPVLGITKDNEEWKYFAKTVELSASYIVVKLSSRGEAWFDNTQLTEFTEGAEKKPFVNTISKTGCCPDNYPNNYCWNGEMCVVSGTRLSEEDVFDVNYECGTDGTWKPKKYFKRVIYGGNIENSDDISYCEENMCFGKPDPTNSEVKLKECVDKGYTIFSDSYDKILAGSQDNSFLKYICTGKHEPDKQDNWQDDFNQKILFYQTYYGCSITNEDWLNLQYKDGEELKYLFGENKERNLEICQLPYNLVKNGGFESWDNGNPIIWGKESGTVSEETQNVIYGSKFLKLKGTIYQSINVEGDKYFALWYKGDESKIDVDQAINGNKEAAYNADGWKLYNGIINLKKFKIITTGEVYIDNVEVFKEEDIGSFEYICTKNGIWDIDRFQEGREFGDLKDTPKRTIDLVDNTIEYTQDQGCCPATYCWGGEAKGCIQTPEPSNFQELGYYFFNQKNDVDAICNKGAWQLVKKKEKYNDPTNKGYCRVNQCWNGKNCVDTGTYVDENGNENQGDNYCEPIYLTDTEGELILDDDDNPTIIDAKWTSRTKLIALQMLEFAKDNAPYTLFCDVGSAEGGKKGSLNTNDVPANTNHYCVLKYGTGNKVLVGTSINGIANLRYYLKAIFNDDDHQNYCGGSDAQTEDNQFHKCENNDVWYNKKTNSVIYSKDGADLKGIKWWQVFKQLRQLFSIKADITENIEFLNSQKFDRSYLYNSGGDNAKTIQALNSERTPKIMFIEYAGFNTNICAVVEPEDKGVCKPTDEENPVYTITTSQSWKDKWQDLTAKLRIK